MAWFRGDYRRALDCWMNLLTTYTYDSELQELTTLSLIYTLYKSLQRLPSLLQPAVSSPAIPWQQLLSVEILQLHMLRFYLHSLSCRTLLNSLSKSKAKLLCTWQFTTNQFVLVSGPLSLMTRVFFPPHLNPCGHSPLWWEDGFVFYEYAWPFVKCMYCPYSMLPEILPFALCTSPLSCQYRLCRANNAYLRYFMLQRRFSHLNGRKLDHRQVKASYIFFVWLRLVLYCKYFHSHYSVWLLLVACTVFFIYIQKVESHVPCGPVCTLENFHCCGEPCFVGTAILRGRWLPLIPRQGKHKSLLIWSVPYGGLI
jgi:hypothetical protein